MWGWEGLPGGRSPRWGGSCSSKFPQSNGTTGRKRPATPPGGVGLILLPALPCPCRKSPWGTETLRVYKMQHLSPPSCFDSACGASPPPQVNTDWTRIGLTQPQVSPPTCSHNPATVLKATPVVAGAQAHHPIQHHPSPSSQKSHIPPNLPQPCGIQTCNPGSFSTGVCCTSPLWCCFQEGTNPSQCKGQER